MGDTGEKDDVNRDDSYATVEEGAARPQMNPPDDGSSEKPSLDQDSTAPQSVPRTMKERRSQPLRPNTLKLQEDLWSEYQNVKSRSERHAKEAQKWHRIARGTRFVVAFAAALSTVSIFAENTVAAAVFAIVTAAGSALDIAFAPGDKTIAHAEAAKGYGHHIRPLSQLIGTEEGEYVERPTYDYETGQSYDAGYYKWSDKTSIEIWKRFRAIRDEIEKVDEKVDAGALVLSPGPYEDPDSQWGLWRQKRILRILTESQKARLEFENRVPLRGPGGE